MNHRFQTTKTASSREASMRTKVLIMGLVLAVAGSVSAKPVHLGLEAGANFTQFRGDDVGTFTATRSGFTGGGFLSLTLVSGIALRPEAIFSQKGAKDPDEETSPRLNYLEIPVLLEILPLPQVGILVGPSFNANVAKTWFNDVQKTDVGMIGGIQFHYDRWFLSGRYELGLIDVQNKTNLKNGTLSVLAGFEIL
jgi:hypothetical protein